MELWSGVLSPFSAKVRIVLAEKGLPYELREVPWTRENLWGPKPPAFLAVSPRGEVPALVDGDTSVYDSTVIVEYLEDRYPEAPMLPSEPADRARCRLVEDEADRAMQVAVTSLIQEVFMKPSGGGRDVERLARASEALHRFYDGLEAELDGREWLGGSFGVADVAAFLVIGFASTLGVPPKEGTRLHGWVARAGARPTVAAELEAITKAAAAA